MNDRDLNPSLLVPNLAVLLLVAIGLLTDKAPLISSRPETPTPTTASSNALARLWEDPLTVKISDQAKAELRASTREAAVSVTEGANDKLRAATEREKGVPGSLSYRVLVLPIMLGGEQNPEAIETRLRTRYAVLSALGRAQYLPVKSDRLLFARIRPRSPSSPRHSFDMPFEQFDVRGLIADNVEFSGHPNNWRWASIAPDRVVDHAADPAHDTLSANHHDSATRLVIPHPYDRIVVCWLDETKILPSDSPFPAAQQLAHSIDAVLEKIAGKSPPPTVLASVPDPRDPQRPLRELEVEIQWELKVIGPSNSDILYSILTPPPATSTPAQPAAPPSNDGPLARLNQPVELLSPRATTAPEVLKISTDWHDPLPEGSPDTLAAPVKWKLIRTIATDEQLVEATLTELKYRHLDLVKAPNKPEQTSHLVLVGEWDTLYSRGISRAFAAKINSGYSPEGPSPGKIAYTDRNAWAMDPPNLHEFSYLRGLDGRTSGEAQRTARPENSAGAGAKKKLDDDNVLERAEGTSQFDYLRRLEGNIRALQTRLRTEKKGDVRAIGVIGSDIYDKLLVLRALRPSFPHVTFFTTDLDAIYLDRRENDWTLNLVVVSPFGLVASEPLQGRIPPFRDSLQTGLFLTVLRAVGVAHIGSQPFDLSPRTIRPRVFELGRTRAVELSNAETGNSANLHAPPPSTANKFWPITALVGALLVGWWWARREPMERSAAAFGLLWLVSFLGCLVFVTTHIGPIRRAGFMPALLAGALLAIPFFRTHRWKLGLHAVDRPRSLRENSFWALICGSAAVIAAGSLWYSWHTIASDPTEEPFAWFEGLSLWPTEIVRIAGAAFAVICIVLAQCRLEKMKVRLDQKYFAPRLSSESPSPSAPGRLPPPKANASRLRETLRRWWLDEEESNEHESLTPVSKMQRKPPQGAGLWELELWQRYCKESATEKRFLRVTACVAGYILAFFLLSTILGRSFSAHLARGTSSYAFDQAIGPASNIVYCFLLFFVLDATILVTNLIAKLTPHIGWPTELDENEAIHLINELTREVAGLVYLPFTVLFMMIISRNRLFEAWAWPPPVIVFFGSGLLLIVLTALILQQRARAAKTRAIDYLGGELLLIFDQDDAPDSPRAYPASREKYLRETREQIASFRGVAFQEWHHNPIFRAILIPLGGIGTLQLLERYASF